MSDNRPFHFKHFSLYHHRSTMKVGTDAVLLGRWVDVSSEDTVLDIGTGCGIIPLMLAQKGVAHVDAVDLDADSVAEAAENFSASQWSDRLQVCEYDIRQYAEACAKRYDLVVSNPPFFVHSFKCDGDRKNMARHTDASMSFDNLARAVKLLLKPEGRFALVLPVRESASFLKSADENGLYLCKQQEIVPIEGKDPNRINMEFRFHPVDFPKKEMLVIRSADNAFTEQYNDFLKDFYLGL